MLVLALCLSLPAYAANWDEGGLLDSGSLGRWGISTDENVLASSAGYIKRTTDPEMLKTVPEQEYRAAAEKAGACMVTAGRIKGAAFKDMDEVMLNCLAELQKEYPWVLSQDLAPVAQQATPLPAPENMVGKPLAIRIVNQKESAQSNGRKRLNIMIVPAEDQSNATQADLLATAVIMAVQAQEKTEAHIVNVTMNCQQAENSFGELQLALVTYIPDGMGINGKTRDKRWTFSAAPRGFTKPELQYLKLWAEMRDNYQTGGTTDEEKLEAAIAKKMGIKPGSLNPHLNIREPIDGKIEIDGDLRIVR